MLPTAVPEPLGPDLKTLVLAGADSRSSRPPAVSRGRRERPLEAKAFQLLQGQLVIEYVLDLLRECGLRRIWVLAPGSDLERIPRRHEFTAIAQEPGAGLFTNLIAGAAAMNPAAGEPVLVMFGDHPVKAPRAFQAFLASCAAQLEDADFFHGFALQGSYREYEKWFARTSVHMREMCGRASGFNLAVPSRLHGLGVLNELYGVRKLEQHAAMFGLLRHLVRWTGSSAPRAVLDAITVYLAKEFEKLGRGHGRRATAARSIERWLAARVPGERLRRHAARVLGAERGVRLIPLPHGGIALDVDFAEELAALQENWTAIQEISLRQDLAIHLPRSHSHPPMPRGSGGMAVER